MLYLLEKQDCRRVKHLDKGGCVGDGGAGISLGPLIGIAEAEGGVKASNDMSRIDDDDAPRSREEIGILQ